MIAILHTRREIHKKEWVQRLASSDNDLRRTLSKLLNQMRILARILARILNLLGGIVSIFL
jgi:hypothetical protein